MKAPKKRILITGSREMTPEMQKKAFRITKQLIAKGVTIIVGEAEGVDQAVVDLANAMHYKHISVYGAYGKMRRKTHDGKNIEIDGSYPERDVAMVNECTGCCSIWNGKSRGTKITFEEALRQEKPVVHLHKAPKKP